MKVCKEKDFSPEALKKANITFEHMFEAVPIVIKSSHLNNVLMWEISMNCSVWQFNSSSNQLVKNLQLLMDRVDEMSQDTIKYNTYMRNTSKQQQQKHQYQQRRQQENMQQPSRSKPLFPEEDRPLQTLQAWSLPG